MDDSKGIREQIFECLLKNHKDFVGTVIAHQSNAQVVSKMTDYWATKKYNPLDAFEKKFMASQKELDAESRRILEESLWDLV